MAISTATEWGVGFTALATGLAAFALSGVQPFVYFSTACIVLGSICFIAGIVFIGHAVVNTPFVLRLQARRSALGVEASVEYLSHVVTTTVDLLSSGFDKRKFAVLKVTNNGSKNLNNVIARCQFNQGVEGRCIWSFDSGEFFHTGGSHGADLDVGDSRLLVVAQGFGANKLWARLSSQEPFEWPASAREYPSNIESYVDLSDRKTLSIASDVLITVRFVAQDLHPVAKRFQLDFDGDEPRITHFGMVPQHQKTIVEQLREWEQSVDKELQSLSDVWNDFFVAAGETVSQFRAMRGGEHPPAAEKWETFKRTAAHASRSATRLPEPYNEQTRALIRPFLDLEQDNLETSVTTANELQSFILKRQAGVQPDPAAGVL